MISIILYTGSDPDHPPSRKDEYTGINLLWMITLAVITAVLVVLAARTNLSLAHERIEQVSEAKLVKKNEGNDQLVAKNKNLESGWPKNIKEEFNAIDNDEYRKLIHARLGRKPNSNEWSYFRFGKTSKAEVIAHLGSNYEVVYEEIVYGVADQYLRWGYGKHRVTIMFRAGLAFNGTFPFLDKPTNLELSQEVEQQND